MVAKFALLVPGFYKIGSKSTTLGLKSNMAKPISLCRLFRRHFEKNLPTQDAHKKGVVWPHRDYLNTLLIKVQFLLKFSSFLLVLESSPNNKQTNKPTAITKRPQQPFAQTSSLLAPSFTYYSLV